MKKVLQFFIPLLLSYNGNSQCDSVTFEKSDITRSALNAIDDKVYSTPYFTIGDMALIKKLSTVIDSCIYLTRPRLFRGFLYLYADSNEKAIMDFNKASGFYEYKNMNVLLNIGYLCRRANKPGVAEKYLLRAISITNADSTSLASAYYLLGNAILWNQSITFQNLNKEAANSKILIKDSVLFYYANAIRLGALSDRQQKVYLHQGDLLFKMGEYQNAIQKFDTQLISHPYDYLTFKYAALANKIVGNEKRSKELIEQFLLLFNPSSVSVRRQSRRKWNEIVDNAYADLKEISQRELNSQIEIEPAQILNKD